MVVNDFDNSEAIFASLTVAALQEIRLPAEKSSLPLWYQLPPSSAYLTSEEMVAKLADLPKPVLCLGLSIARGLVICTWTLPSAYRNRSRMLRSFAEGIRDELSNDRLARVLVRTQLNEIQVTPDHLVIWLTQYYFPHVQMSADKQSDIRDSSATTYVLTFHSLTGGSVVPGE